MVFVRSVILSSILLSENQPGWGCRMGTACGSQPMPQAATEKLTYIIGLAFSAAGEFMPDGWRLPAAPGYGVTPNSQ
jgi:hypothetical protein